MNKKEEGRKKDREKERKTRGFSPSFTRLRGMRFPPSLSLSLSFFPLSPSLPPSYKISIPEKRSFAENRTQRYLSREKKLFLYGELHQSCSRRAGGRMDGWID
jgi:hypothetical protein